MTIQRTPKNFRGIVLTTIALAGIITLASCAPTPTETPAPTETPISQPSAQPTTPVETEAPAEEPAEEPEAPATDIQAGETVDAATAEKLNSEWRSAEDDKAYTLPDGSNVVIKGGQPLPEPVIAAVTDKVAAAGAGQNVSDGIAAGKAAGDAVRALKAETANTGRSGVLITHAMSTSGPDGAQTPTYGVSLPQGGPYSTYEEALAAAQAWVDISPDTRYIVFVDTLG